MRKSDDFTYRRKIERLIARNNELEETIGAIRRGEVDALILNTPDGDRVFTLKSAEQPYRELVEAMNEGAATISADGLILYCNSKFAAMIGSSLERVIGTQVDAIFDEKNKTTFSALLQKSVSRPASGEITIRSAAGADINFQLSINRIRNLDLDGFCIVATDLAELKHVEEKLRQANENLERRVQERTEELTEALRARDEFLSIASHELKTPLTALKLQLQISSRELMGDNKKIRPEDELAREIAMSLKQVDTLANLVDDLLDISRARNGNFILQPGPVHVQELIQNVVDRLSEPLGNAQCQVQMAVEEHLIGNWDERRLEQVFVNLIVNAIKYAPRSPIKISAMTLGRNARFIVQDFGPGIAEEKQPLIFDKFERADASNNVSGMGLGLFIVKKIVESHHGQIHVESSLGKGTTFVIDLPILATSN